MFTIFTEYMFLTIAFFLLVSILYEVYMAFTTVGIPVWAIIAMEYVFVYVFEPIVFEFDEKPE